MLYELLNHSLLIKIIFDFEYITTVHNTTRQRDNVNGVSWIWQWFYNSFNLTNGFV